MQQLTFTANTR